MYAIKNKRTGKWWYGTDKRYWPFHQRSSFDQAVTFEDWEVEEVDDAIGEAGIEAFMRSRRMSKNYVPVKVRLVEVTDDSTD